VASVRSCEKLPPCLIKPVPAGSKTDPLLAKDEPISDGGSTSDNIFKKGQSVRSPAPEAEGAAETMCDELTATPIPWPPQLLGGRRERNGSEAEPRKKGGVGGRCFKIWIYFSLSSSDLIGDELNSLFSPSSVCFVHDGNR